MVQKWNLKDKALDRKGVQRYDAGLDGNLARYRWKHPEFDGVGVRFTSTGIKISYGSELEGAAVKLRLDGKDFVNQTLRTLCWIKDGRDAGRKGRQQGDIVMLGVERICVTRVFESIECARATVLRLENLVREIHRSIDKYFLAANRNRPEARRDTALVNYNRAEEARLAMDGRWGREAIVPFSVDVLEGPSLALVQWFDIRWIPEPVTNMYVVTKTERYEGIELSTIERGVHLIPDFGRVGATLFPLEGDNRLRGLDGYDRFVMNIYTDLDAYNNYFWNLFSNSYNKLFLKQCNICSAPSDIHQK